MYTWVSFLPSFLPLETRTLEEGKVGGESGGACHYLTPARSQDIARVLGVLLTPTVDKAAAGLGPACGWPDPASREPCLHSAVSAP